jgi:hypothetical protein
MYGTATDPGVGRGVVPNLLRVAEIAWQKTISRVCPVRYELSGVLYGL